MPFWKYALTPILAMGLFSPVLASPAQNLFDQATFIIGFNYNGPIKLGSFRDLRKKYQPQLDQACTGLGEQCGYVQAKGVIQNILQTINDPFTLLVSSAELEDDDRFGSGLGPVAPRIGVWAKETSKGLVVTEAFLSEPAYKAGIRRGDVIAQIAGQPATLARLKEAEASPKAVSVQVLRQGESRELSLTPQAADESMQPKLEVVGTTAILRVYHFYSSREFSTARQIQQLVAQAEQKGAKGLVLDLRDALTGFDTEALLAAGVFMPKVGFIYQSRFQGQSSSQRVENGRYFEKPENQEEREARNQSLPKAFLSKLPLVVLVNHNTINSAEMLAYFLQSGGRAKVVGEPTAGALGVSGGAEGPLLSGDFLAVSSLRLQQLDGTLFPMRLTPDVQISDDPEALAAGHDLVLDRALELLKGGL